MCIYTCVVSCKGSVSLEMPEYTVSEDQLEVQVCWNLNPANLTLERSLDFFATTQPASATESDFAGVARDVTLMPAVPSNLELCINVDINEDVIIENQERFMLTLMSMDSAVNFNLNSHISQVCISIVD